MSSTTTPRERSVLERILAQVLRKTWNGTAIWNGTQEEGAYSLRMPSHRLLIESRLLFTVIDNDTGVASQLGCHPEDTDTTSKQLRDLFNIVRRQMVRTDARLEALILEIQKSGTIGKE